MNIAHMQIMKYALEFKPRSEKLWIGEPDEDGRCEILIKVGGIFLAGCIYTDGYTGGFREVYAGEWLDSIDESVSVYDVAEPAKKERTVRYTVKYRTDDDALAWHTPFDPPAYDILDLIETSIVWDDL
jgi:hypothetical protein